MAPLTRWVEGDGHVLGARCRRTCDFCVSLVTVHVGPTWVSFKGSLPRMERASGQPASLSTVGCKPGHGSPWDTVTEMSVKGSDAINPQAWEKGSLRETFHFCGSPFWQVFQQSRSQQLMQGIRRRRGAYAGRTQAYGEPCHLVAGFHHYEFWLVRNKLFRRPAGQPFFLNLVVHASGTSTSTGALGLMPRGTQGLSKGVLNKVFSFRKEVRSGSRWS